MNASLRTLLTLTASAAACTSLHAGDTKAAVEVGKYELKKKSTFTLSAERRAPFWPIGWVKRTNEVHTEITQGPRPKLDEKNFNVTSIMLGNPSLAVVNGRAYSEGEMIRLPKGSVPMKVRVQQIGDGTVTLNYEQQNFVISLKRPELASHPSEGLLNAERE